MKDKLFSQYEKIILLKMQKSKQYYNQYEKNIFNDLVNQLGFKHKNLKRFFECVYQ